MVFGGVHLPWEWTPENRIRNTIYPYYLSILLRLVKHFGIDDAMTVRNSYYLAHSLLIILGDYFYIKVGKLVIGDTGTKIAMYFYLSNKFYNTHIIHAFINSFEAILSIIIFYFYFKI
jgi:hypothetical protein